MSTNEKNQRMIEQDALKNLNVGNFKSQEISSEAIKALKQNLYKAKQKLSEFVQKIEGIKNSPIREDVLEHCDNLKLKLDASKQFPYARVEKLIQNRIQKMIKNKKIKHNWSQDDIFILLWVLSKYLDYHQTKNIQTGIDQKIWPNISQMIPGIQNSDACKFKWLSLRNNKLTQNNWLDAQSIQLDKIVRETGGQDWQQISKRLYDNLNIPNKIYRCAKQCRQHWNCYLNPKLKKGPWSKKQDLILLTCVQNYNGLRKWTEIVNKLEGRTENALKNRFQLLLKKERENNKQLKQVPELELVKYLKSKLYHELENDESNLQQHLNKYISSTITTKIGQIEKKNKRVSKKNEKNQKKQQPELYKPPRKRKEIKKQKPYLRYSTNRLKNVTHTPIKFQHEICRKDTRILLQNSIGIQDEIQDDQSEQMRSYDLNSMDEQFKIETSKQFSNIQAKLDMIESGSALQLSQISPFKPYCLQYSSKNIEKQLRFEEEFPESQLKSQNIEGGSENHKNSLNVNGQNQQEASEQNQRQTPNFKQFQVHQMNSQRLIQHILSKYGQINIRQTEYRDQVNDNEKESNITIKSNNSFCAIVINDQRLKFLPCVLEKNSQKLIPFHFKKINQANQ